MNRILRVITRRSTKSKSFFDLSEKEQKRIVTKAAKESNRMQRDLIARYKRLFPA